MHLKRGGGDWAPGGGGGGGGWGQTQQIGLMGKQKEKKEKNTEENYIKNGEKGLKNASFWVMNSIFFSGGSSDPHPLHSLCHRGKK